MAKRVFFIRHAKSSWSDPRLADLKRPLNTRGLRDAPFMAQLLRGQVQGPIHIVSSPAVRAFTTAEYFAKAFGLEANHILRDQRLYMAGPGTILEVLRELNEKWETVLMFGHNPGYTMLANHFSDEWIDNVPTCGIVEVTGEVNHWYDFGKETARLVRFQYPKQFFS